MENFNQQQAHSKSYKKEHLGTRKAWAISLAVIEFIYVLFMAISVIVTKDTSLLFWMISGIIVIGIFHSRFWVSPNLTGLIGFPMLALLTLVIGTFPADYHIDEPPGVELAPHITGFEFYGVAFGHYLPIILFVYLLIDLSIFLRKSKEKK